MKLIKYLALFIIVALLGACSDKEVTYMADPVDETANTYLQIHYFVPVKAVAANYIYKIAINGQEYQNNGSSYLVTYNGVPGGGTNLYYTAAAGNVSLKFFDKDGEIVYENNVQLEAGKHYNVFVYDLNQAPQVIESGEMPVFPGAAETATHCNVRFYNFLYEADGTPFQDKLQLVLQGRESKAYDEPMGQPFGFGECTEWLSPEIIKSIYNSSGYERRYYCFHVIDAQTGDDKGQLTYINSKGNEVAWTDYWTWYVGRSYRLIAGGIRTSSSVSMVVPQWTAL